MTTVGGTHDSVIVVAVFAVVLVSVIWVGIAVALRVVGVVCVLDVLVDLIGPAIRRRQIIKWPAGGVEERRPEVDKPTPATNVCR